MQNELKKENVFNKSCEMNLSTIVQNKISSETPLDEIQDLLHETYQEGYKQKIRRYNNPTNEKGYITDVLKLEYLKYIFPFKLDKVEVKKSNVAGNGLFAKKKIMKDELITFYPGDIVEYTPNRDRHTHNHVMMNFSSKRYEDQCGSLDGNTPHCNYAYTINEYYTIIGCPDFKQDQNYLGHFINDGAKCKLNRKIYVDNYMTKSMRKSNCSFRDLKALHVAVVATKNIDIGEELFVTYGQDYWKDHNSV